uniref:Uncharacterized protein n=1 Tax=Moniliophthora roreri TaxID=221103 RepID=A0A0W0G1J1_MONRR
MSEMDSAVKVGCTMSTALKIAASWTCRRVLIEWFLSSIVWKRIEMIMDAGSHVDQVRVGWASSFATWHRLAFGGNVGIQLTCVKQSILVNGDDS